MFTATEVKREHNYGCIQLDVDDFSEDVEFLTVTFDDGTVEVSYLGHVVAVGTVDDYFEYGDLAREVLNSDPYDFADDYDWREDR